MKKEAIIHPNPLSNPAVWNRWRTIHQFCSIYLELGKARLSAMVVVTAIAGFFLASPDVWDGALFLWVTLGTACAALGANSLNQWWEIPRDSWMERTCRRPLPAGQISSMHALGWAMVISGIGIFLLATQVNGLTAGLAALNIFLYVLIYTPLKAHSALCTIVGAVCGAIPPMMGWTAVTGRLEYGAWLLGATLFIWQIPHFMALAWMYREDYARGGFRMLPLTDRDGRMTCNITLIYSLALLPLGLAYYLGGLTGYLFLIGSFILGAGFVWLSLRLYLDRNDNNARRLFLASIFYLPLLLSLMIADRGAAFVPETSLRVSWFSSNHETTPIPQSTQVMNSHRP